MIGITPPTVRERRPGPGNHKLPLRCTDEGCPSRRECKRPGFAGEPHDFKHNRGEGAICAYFVSREGEA
ncbi:hypothetical protein [Pseudodesulfovibrio pelocollis]|uniref:hypothetical protein n=1 Tax=Pseudodesulfovibrio pelocollis TaxID=3051432 RepID=UPI00255AC333|nr:hypothetical protein [Pseudodesulfovibrio sp. SB368]